MSRITLKPKVEVEKKPRITMKQRKFAKHYVELGNGTEAAIRAGYSAKTREVAATVASDNMRNPNVKAEIENLMKEAGLTKPQLLKWHYEAINSGVGRDSRNSDALRGIVELYKLYDMYPSKKVNIEKREISLQLGQKESNELAELVRKQQEKLDLLFPKEPKDE